MPFRETTAADLSNRNLGFGIDVTTHCNLDCLICYYLDSPENQAGFCNSHLSASSFERAMSQASLAGFREIYVLGGEPTVHPEILDLLQCAGEFGFQQVLLVTNGIRMAERPFCEAVAATGADIVVQRHVIGSGPALQEIQDTLVGKKGTLGLVNKAFDHIESVFEPSRVAIQCCMTRPVVESGQIYEVFRYAKSRGYEHVIECTKASARFARGNPLDLSPGELSVVYKQLEHIDVEEFGGVSSPWTPQAYGKTCHMPENSLHCLVDGTIIPCVGQPFSLGNIFAGENACLEAILDSPLRNFFRYPLERIHGHCRGCPDFEICTGGCRGDAFFLTGCFSASAVQCPQLANYRKALSRRDFLPPTCHHCVMRDHSLCGPKKDTDERLSNYLGAMYRNS